MAINATGRYVLAFVLATCFAGLILGQAPETGGLPSATIPGSLVLGSPVWGSPVWSYLLKAAMIFCVNIVLSGDNGVMIAMTVGALPQVMKFRAIAIGAGLALMFQVAATLFAVKLLHVRFVQLAGGFAILWISLRLFSQTHETRSSDSRKQGFWRAIWLILVGDLTMSTDNILAIAAMAKGDMVLLSLGLGLSVVVVVCASTFLSFLIGKYPIIVYSGAAILGNVAAEMILTDPFTQNLLTLSLPIRYCVQVAVAIAVIIAGYLIERHHSATPLPATSHGSSNSTKDRVEHS